MDMHAQELRILAQQNRSFILSKVNELFFQQFNRSIRTTYQGKIKALFLHFPDLFDMELDRKINQWIATSKVYDTSSLTTHRVQQELEEGELDESIVSNVSGVWLYPADDQFRMVLQEDATTGHVLGIMLFNNETQCLVKGDKESGRGSHYRVTKIYSYGQRSQYSIDLGSDNDHMTFTRDRDLKSKSFILGTKQIPPHFLKEIVCAVNVHDPCTYIWCFPCFILDDCVTEEPNKWERPSRSSFKHNFLSFIRNYVAFCQTINMDNCRIPYIQRQAKICKSEWTVEAKRKYSLHFI